MDDAGTGISDQAKLRAMRTVSDRIEVPEDDVYRLAAQLAQHAWLAVEVTERLHAGRPVGGPLQGAVEGFTESHRAAAGALARELRWLAHTVAQVVDSWRALDRALVGAVEAAPR